MSELTDYAGAALAEVADSDAAAVMQAYMKTEMPFYGVKRPQRKPIERALAREFPASSACEYRTNVAAWWNLAHREVLGSQLQSTERGTLSVIQAQRPRGW